MELISMQAFARRLLQEAAVAVPPAATPIPADSAANQRPASSDGGSSSIPTSSVVNSPFNVSSHFSPTMVIILVILLSAFFFMGFFAIYVRRCTTDDSFSQRGGNTRGGASRRHEAAAGLQRGLGVDPALVESFPMVSYAAAKKKGCNECVVCLADFERGEALKQLPKCKHVFHPGCIDMWLESHATCPLCRRSLVNSDRWSMSWRWGGSSRGASWSGRLNDGDSSHPRQGGEQGAASPGLVQAGSNTGWQMVIPGRNGDESLQAGAQEEVHGGLPGLPSSAPPACSVTSSSMEIVSRDNLQVGCAFCGRPEVAVPRRKNGASRFSSEMGVVSMMQAAASQGRRRLGRSNSTGHSLRKDVMSRAAAAAMQGAPRTGCMPLSQFPLLRSRSIGREEEEAMVDPNSATSDQSPLSAGGCTRPALLRSEK